jgi:hypothetical protein
VSSPSCRQDRCGHVRDGNDISARCASPPLESAVSVKRKSAPRAALEAVAAAPRPSCEIEDSQPVKHRRDQTPHAIAVVEGCQCVGRCADLRLMAAVDDVGDYEGEDGLDGRLSPQVFPERGACVDAGGGRCTCGCVHEDLLSN